MATRPEIRIAPSECGAATSRTIDSSNPELADKVRITPMQIAGLFWTVRGANAILTLQCCHFNGRFEDYWKARRARSTVLHHF
jgi:hypothetical protein